MPTDVPLRHRAMRPLRVTGLAVCIVVVAIAYQPAWNGGLLWDDDAHVTRAEMRGAAGLRAIWFEPGTTQQYYPLLHSAFWVLHKAFGNWTLPYHLVTIALHGAAAFLLAIILHRLTAGGALLAAAIFALHPVHVESVAWISELKNTLSAVFYLSAAFTYLRFDADRDRRSYALAALLFVLALLTKTVSATLPAALLLILWWKRGALSWRRDVLPLLPWLALAVLAGTITAAIERTMVGAQGRSFDLTGVERVLLAGRACWFYLGKLAWPIDLAFIYPRWRIAAADAAAWVYPVGLALLLAALWLVRRYSKSPLTALLFFVGTLVPALGFVDLYPFKYSFVANHFQYLPSIGPIALFSSSVARLAARGGWRRGVATVVAVACVGTLGALTRQASSDYTDAETLYRATLRRNPSATMAHINLALLYLEPPSAPPDRLERARAHLARAVALEPDNDEARGNLGAAFARLGRAEDAVREYREALRLNPRNRAAHHNLGAALERLGRLDAAAAAYRAALALGFDAASAHAGLGRALLAMDQPGEAVPHLTAALRGNAADGQTRYLLGAALAASDRLPQAAEELRRALTDPAIAASAEAHNDLGVVLARLGKMDAAAAEFRRALDIDPAFAAARENLERAATVSRRQR